MWRKMLSRTTTASSIRMPMTSDSAINVIMLIVKPTMYMKKNVAMTDVGSASDVIKRRAPVAHEHEHDEHGHDAAEDDVAADVADVLFDALQRRYARYGFAAAGSSARLWRAPRRADSARPPCSHPTACAPRTTPHRRRSAASSTVGPRNRRPRRRRRGRARSSRRWIAESRFRSGWPIRIRPWCEARPLSRRA